MAFAIMRAKKLNSMGTVAAVMLIVAVVSLTIWE